MLFFHDKIVMTMGLSVMSSGASIQALRQKLLQQLAMVQFTAEMTPTLFL